jgi:hypothetical protein
MRNIIAHISLIAGLLVSIGASASQQFNVPASQTANVTQSLDKMEVARPFYPGQLVLALDARDDRYRMGTISSVFSNGTAEVYFEDMPADIFSFARLSQEVRCAGRICQGKMALAEDARDDKFHVGYVEHVFANQLSVVSFRDAASDIFSLTRLSREVRCLAGICKYDRVLADDARYGFSHVGEVSYLFENRLAEVEFRDYPSDIFSLARLSPEL